MKKPQFTDEQIVMALHMAEQTSVDEVIRKLGIAQASFYHWETRFAGLFCRSETLTSVRRRK